MSLCFTTTRRVEFRDTDAAGIAHFSVFFVYMEQAEHELFRHLGLSVLLNDDQGEVSWPRVSASCDYREPAQFEEVLDIEVTVQRLGRKSVTYGFRFTRAGREIATGSTTAVCCRMRPGQSPEPITIPSLIAKKLHGPEATARG
jgi:4-hydroxybenzoyl-CoA thioesterase/acyl-CoA thioester hydrolase